METKYNNYHIANIIAIKMITNTIISNLNFLLWCTFKCSNIFIPDENHISFSLLAGEGKPNLQAVAMALSGFTEDRNALWRRTCGTLRYQLENPYLRAIFAFAACDDDNYDDVLVCK